MSRLVSKTMRSWRIAGIGMLGALTVSVALGAPGAPSYDLDGNGVVDDQDAAVIKATMGKCQGTAGYDARADYDGDQCVTFADYQKWYAAYKGQ